jgi:hypothetical protein
MPHDDTFYDRLVQNREEDSWDEQDEDSATMGPKAPTKGKRLRPDTSGGHEQPPSKGLSLGSKSWTPEPKPKQSSHSGASTAQREKFPSKGGAPPKGKGKGKGPSQGGRRGGRKAWQEDTDSWAQESADSLDPGLLYSLARLSLRTSEDTRALLSAQAWLPDLPAGRQRELLRTARTAWRDEIPPQGERGQHPMGSLDVVQFKALLRLGLPTDDGSQEPQ